MEGDGDYELQALTIATAIESGEPVATRISRRQRERDIVCDRHFSRSDGEIGSDDQWAGREFG